MISAMCKVVQDVVPYCLVDGQPSSLVSVNKIGLERNGKSPEAIAAVTKAYKTLFRSGLLREDAIRQAREEHGDVPEVEHMLSFMEADNKRGITAAHSTPRR
jgi:UDP-N-acetylglucosamine acyltransferase